jgi:hypothetical protein
MQATCLSYLESNDKLTGADFKRWILEVYDENGDGVIDYHETGKFDWTFFMAYLSDWLIHEMSSMELLKFRFLILTAMLKLLKK